MWLYGTGGGAHWPKCEVLQSNYDTRQFYNRRLQLAYDGLEPHAQECVEFARDGGGGWSLAGAGRGVAAGAKDPGRDLSESGEGGRGDAVVKIAESSYGG